ncbi:hypothetical protein AVEN_191019-1 [Araneus ventricosus]|uniref:Uncharacterized protein n=1 Tax=Araneus ventricosus TaxID=182803 RepID=A0A4Y2PF90_ARAVE|nr:hypothetical protein AVEN_191019-1 [Araneus ventricosus]
MIIWNLEGESPSIRALGIKALSRIAVLLGVLALRPTTASVDPCRTRKLSKSPISLTKSEANRRKPRQFVAGKSTITEVKENPSVTVPGGATHMKSKF